MAQAFAERAGIEARSAGSRAETKLHDEVVDAMREIGIDISAQRSTSIDELAGPFDVCVTVCDSSCPIPPRAGLQLRWRSADPALAGGTEEERMAAFRIVRDAIGGRVRALVTRLEKNVPAAT